MMYEPLTLTKKKPRTISGTPAAKVFLIVNLAKILIPFAAIGLLSHYVSKKKKFIAELDEVNLFNKKLNIYDELKETKHLWQDPNLQTVVSEVLRRYHQKEELTETFKANN